MNLGITSGAYPDRYGEAAGFARMREHGYVCLDYQGFINTADPVFRLPEREFQSRLETYRTKAEEQGICIWQVHAPWQWPAAMDRTKEDREYQLIHYAKAVRGAAYLGSKYYAVHNIMPFGEADTDPDYVRQLNMEFFGRLLQTAQEYDVTLCLENMPFRGQCLAHPLDTLGFVKELNSPHMKMCLDTGHSMVLGMQPGDAVRAIGAEHLQILHVHDNDGVLDRHWLPYTGVIDWEDFSAALHQIGFDGCFSLETEADIRDLPEEEAANKQLELARMAKELAG